MSHTGGVNSAAHEDQESSGCYLKMKRPSLHMVDGVPMASTFLETTGKIQNFQAKSDDVLIVSYPKAGTMWMIEIVDCIRRGGVTKEIQTVPNLRRAPFLEIAASELLPSGVDLLEAMPSPRLVKSHLPVKMLPRSFWDNNCKIVYIARNAKDVLVSYYFFHKSRVAAPDPGTWEEFFENYLSGNVGFGSWFDHVTTWWDIREKHPILYVFYEDIIQDPVREVQRVARFLGKTLEKDVISEIVEHTSFNKMKDNPMTNHSTMPPSMMNLQISRFMRKGKVGDWKNHLTVAQNERFEEEYKQRMAKTSLHLRDEL
uniref:Sulfotransferase n=1 Tax=Erpetoichthys calabaricus TaxID=27687 RepID=A0A8C4XCK5_ERPCA